MTDRPAPPRRTCPACTRRYAGLIAPDCPICHGLGVLTLGAAALHHYDPAPVARAVELHLEHTARTIRTQLPLGDHRQALEAAVDELRLAGVLASTADAAGTPAHTTTPDTTSTHVAELDAYRVARQLGTTPDTRDLNTLAAPDLPLDQARPRDGRPPTASATGNPTAIATIADPIASLGPDVAELEHDRYRRNYRARVIARAVTTAATGRGTQAPHPAPRPDGSQDPARPQRVPRVDGTA